MIIEVIPTIGELIIKLRLQPRDVQKLLGMTGTVSNQLRVLTRLVERMEREESE